MPIRIIYSFSFLIFLTLALVNMSNGGIMEYTKALKISEEALFKNGIAISQYEVLHDPENKNWIENYLNNKNFRKYHEALLNELADKEYWVFQFWLKRSPNENIKGGGIFVFVEKHNGEVIMTLNLK